MLTQIALRLFLALSGAPDPACTEEIHYLANISAYGPSTACAEDYFAGEQVRAELVSGDDGSDFGL